MHVKYLFTTGTGIKKCATTVSIIQYKREKIKNKNHLSDRFRWSEKNGA
jgi:hypothetical protein